MLPEFGEEKSISIKEIYEKIRYYINSVFKQWVYILLFGAIGAAGIGAYAFFSKSYYEADLTIVVKSKDAKAMGLDNILGQLGWGASGGNANLAKVKSVAYSKSVLKEALYDSAMIKGKQDLIIGHFVELYKLKDKWKDSKTLQSFKGFDITQKDNDSSLKQNVAFGVVLKMVRANKDDKGILAIKLDDETDMISFKVRSVNEELSYNLSNSIFHNLNEFYLHDEVANTKSTLTSLQIETDSVGRLLKSKELELASAQDRNYGIILRSNQANQNQILRDIEVLTEVYAEMRKNLELRQFSLKTNSSMFDVLERPALPLDKKSKSIPIYTIIGLVLGFVLSILVIVIRRFLLDELK
jgi:hypothetical protein